MYQGGRDNKPSRFGKCAHKDLGSILYTSLPLHAEVHPSRSQGLLNQPEKKAQESCLIDHWFRPCVDGGALRLLATHTCSKTY